RIAPSSSSVRIRRKHCGADRCTCAATSTFEARPSSCKCLRILRSVASSSITKTVFAVSTNDYCVKPRGGRATRTNIAPARQYITPLGREEPDDGEEALTSARSRGDAAADGTHLLISLRVAAAGAGSVRQPADLHFCD